MDQDSTTLGSPLSIALLERYLAGEASPHETADVEAWIAADRRRATFRRDGVRPLAATSTAGADALVDDAWHRVAEQAQLVPSVRGTHKLVEVAPTISPVSSNRHGRSPRLTLRRVVAGVSAVAAIAVAVVVTPTLWSAFYTSGSATTVTYTTASAERETVRLPDGSVVTLAPESHIQYRATPRGARTVELAGQALFVVTHDPRRSFTVYSGDVRVQVLGTTFDVAHYPGDRAVRVAVVDGKVAGQSPSVRSGAPLVLTPGDASEFADSIVTTTTTRDLGALTSWTNGRLVFRNVPVSDVLDALRRWCGYEFRGTDSSMTAQRVSTELVVANPGEAMRMLQELLDVSMTIDSNVVTIRRHRTARPPVAPRQNERGTFPLPREVGK